MKDALITTLRNRNSGTAEFRKASDLLAQILCAETLAKLTNTEISVETPVGKTSGLSMPDDVMVVPILRAALAFLPAFMQMMPDVPVGMLGIARDERTAQASEYYRKLPANLPSRAIILDPMLGTGGSASLAVNILVSEGYKAKDIYFTGVVAVHEGIDRLAEAIPLSNISVAVIDVELNEQKYIFPGLGDYGDRYFGT